MKKYPFNEGDIYYTIDNDEIIESYWDHISEEMYSKHTKYFHTFTGALDYLMTSKQTKIMDNKIRSTERCVNYEYIKTDPVIEALKKEFDQRSFVGIKKYNTTLHENNEDDFLVHLHEELMDACAYIMKLRMKRNK
jgi:hypothetical protein